MDDATPTLLAIRSRVKMLFAVIMLCFLFLDAFTASAASPRMPRRLKVGTSITLRDISPDKLKHAKAVGIDYIEVGMGTIKVDITGSSYSVQDKAGAIRQLQQAKKAADDAGITIWSVHMLAGAQFEISKADEAERRKVVELQKYLVVNMVSILRPKIVLFHPSFFIPKNEKELRTRQLIKSATELDQAVKSIGAIMVLENMNDASDKHMVLMQTTSDILETLNRVPHDIYSAVDLNHIGHPEQTILALGKRLKTLHVSDGTGIQEKHWSPCSGKGVNDWTAILSALNEVGYSGPFMFEVARSEYSDFEDLTSCYDKMYATYVHAQSER